MPPYVVADQAVRARSPPSHLSSEAPRSNLSLGQVLRPAGIRGHAENRLNSPARPLFLSVRQRQNSGVALQINLPEAKGVVRQFRDPQVSAMSICRCAALRRFAFPPWSLPLSIRPACGDCSYSVSTVNSGIRAYNPPQSTRFWWQAR